MTHVGPQGDGYGARVVDPEESPYVEHFGDRGPSLTREQALADPMIRQVFAYGDAIGAIDPALRVLLDRAVELAR